MVTREVWEAEYKPHVVDSARQRITAETIETVRLSLTERKHNRWIDIGLHGLWENMRAAFGDVAPYENMLLDPEWILDYCRTYTDLYLEELRIIHQEAGKSDGAWFFDDLGYKGATFCSPEQETTSSASPNDTATRLRSSAVSTPGYSNHTAGTRSGVK